MPPTSIRVENRTKGLDAKLLAEMRRKSLQAGHLIRNHCVTSLAGTRTGRTYKVPGTNRTYVASAPGEYPAVRTGALRASIKIALRGSAAGAFVEVWTSVPYAARLEGTKGNGMRPFLRRAAQEKEAEVMAILGQGWQLT